MRVNGVRFGYYRTNVPRTPERCTQANGAVPGPAGGGARIPLPGAAAGAPPRMRWPRHTPKDSRLQIRFLKIYNNIETRRDAFINWRHAAPRRRATPRAAPLGCDNHAQRERERARRTQATGAPTPHSSLTAIPASMSSSSRSRSASVWPVAPPRTLPAPPPPSSASST